MTGWSAVVVFKGRGGSKTRLDVPGRAALAEAFLLDTLAAVAAAEPVAALLLVTSDPGAAERARNEHPQLVVVPDPGTLDAAVSTGAGTALRRRPDAPVIVLTGDLPALVPSDLARALALPALPAVVPDREGSGTTALLLAAGALVAPAFGPGSLARHRDAGCTVLALPVTSTLRLDVDTLADLGDAEETGVGPHTARALAAVA
ncbi:2-phospho-L-lactate guanylyltransferase [Rathayibacter tritici]|uniref:Phosphoenolpyruvate guanylyltransferase n=1 Tax=Rathayibacter tritici TaxID=33888 RepID=A0A169C0H7_9MICO|nr:2-phospho-L-lactate guanylyltransferase [Rathayibacter tritici]AND16771.1 2-phospho-L-lactate guanylyltransferase [Rathayibacter tritici]PPF30855.1 2-phospho-L-lactate guanylyltransferase [Rathayibacter tritici]PPF66393.1 2-phospho-L-lactate guanylyltransferase [Rathayibacter tritici]PPG09572.1 2-phospho-L-lactate guanylyltransferase [Rathayibacter tritici]PPI13616.1 2-phospho-L-lactate guanylyltransferase [Rathayibacter tritici]